MQRTDFPYYAHLFALPQNLWDLSCWGSFPRLAVDPVSVEQPLQRFQPKPLRFVYVVSRTKACMQTEPVFSLALQAWCDFLTMPHTHLSIRLELDNGDRIGPGKIALLEAIQAKGSIAAAARHLGMSYRRAWLLVQQINHALQQPAIATPRGRTVVTPLGRRVINLYHSIENLTRGAAFQELQEIARLTRRRPPDRKKRARQTG